MLNHLMNVESYFFMVIIKKHVYLGKRNHLWYTGSKARSKVLKLNVLNDSKLMAFQGA